MAKKGEEKPAEMTIVEDEDIPQEGGGEMVNRPQTAMEKAHDGFSGLGVSTYPDRVIIDGTQLVYKNQDGETAVDKIEATLKGGRAVWQTFLEDTNTFIKSYDNNVTTDGEPVSLYPGLRHCFELDWTEADDNGDEQKFQMVCPPTSRYMFEQYAKQLMKENLALTDVTTIITAERVQNKDKQRYSKAVFNCQQLLDTGWSPKL